MKKTLPKVFRALWFTSMASFFLSFLGFQIYASDSKYYQYSTVAWLTSIGLGIVFFLLYLIFKSNASKNRDRAFRQVVIQGVIALVLCIVAMPVAAKGMQLAKVGKVSPSPTPQHTNFVDDYKLFGMVNDYRSSQKLSTVSQDDETCNVAQKRVDKYFWQNDVNINDYKDACPTCTSLAVAESKDNYDLDSILNSWKENKNTLNTLRTQYKYGCVKTSGGNVALVMVNKSTPTKATVVTNYDPIVDCVSSAPNCNGSSIKAKKSLCSKITCCQIGNSWSVYPSSEDCTKAQNGANPAPAQVTKPSTGLNYYCYDNTYKYWYYTSSGEQCNLDNSKSACRGLVKSTYDLCMSTCLSQAGQDSSACIYTYDSSSPEYQQCIDAKSAKHQSCMDACAKPYHENTTKCN